MRLEHNAPWRTILVQRYTIPIISNELVLAARRSFPPSIMVHSWYRKRQRPWSLRFAPPSWAVLWPAVRFEVVDAE
jgi:hypothetical protein